MTQQDFWHKVRSRPLANRLAYIEKERKDCYVGIGIPLIYVPSTRPSRGGFLRTVVGKPKEVRLSGSLSGWIAVSPNWYIRGGPHAAVSGVGEPRERQALKKGLPLGDARRSLAHAPQTATQAPPLSSDNYFSRLTTIRFPVAVHASPISLASFAVVEYSLAS